MAASIPVVVQGLGAGRDEIRIDATPPIHLHFRGGVFGDDATAGAVLRAAKVISAARRGMVTVLDLPLGATPV